MYNPFLRTLFFFLLCLVSINLYSQIGSIIPSDRQVDWTTVGYMRNPLDNIPTVYTATYQLPLPSMNAATNSSSIEAALNWAQVHSGLVCVQFQSGTYNINKSIILGGCCRSDIVLKGNGPENTTINYVGGSNLTHSLIRCGGYLSDRHKIIITAYNSSTNTVTLRDSSSLINAGDYITIKIYNGPWQDDQNDFNHGWVGPTRDYLGQIVKVTNVAGKVLTLQDDISLTWSIMHETNIDSSTNSYPYIQKLSADSAFISPAPSNIGIQDLKLTSNGAYSNFGAHIRFENVVNCWVKNVESDKPYRIHVGISNSTAIEIRGCYFYDADSIGTGGFGYGVEMDGPTTNSLIIDNIFRHLRHSVILQLSPNKNVIAYNYSSEEFSGYPNIKLGDFQIHGHYPYANLFEGNRGDRFFADGYWGNNGPYNTFIRNFSNYYDCKIVNSNKVNLLGNEFLLTVINSTNLFDLYGYLKTDSSPIPHTVHKKDLDHNTYMPVISYFYSSGPPFITSSLFTWPPIGPPVNASGILTTQNIPMSVFKIKKP